MADALRVLLVDDADDTRHLLRLVFSSRGVEVVGEAQDGATAIELARAHSPDLIVLDLEMPVMSGMEALPELRLAAPAAQVVILSHRERDRYEGPTASLGAVGYVEKRTPQGELFDEIVLAAGILDAALGSANQTSSRLPTDRRSAGAARRFVEGALESWGSDDVLDTVTLLVSEVVANAVVHAGTALDLTVQLQADRLRVEVSDADPASPMLQQADTETTSGRGMFLVDTLASHWGVIRRPAGKTVWFELDRSGHG